MLWLLVGAAAGAATVAPNDDFADRVALTDPPLTVSGENFGSSLEVNEPPAFHELSSVWYSWTAPANGSVQITITSTDFLPILRVYAGTNLADLQEVGLVFGGQANAFEALAGTAYQLRVAGDAPVPAPPPEGYFVFSLRYNPSPSNDFFAQRQELTGHNVQVIASTIGASREPDEPVHADPCGAHSVWFSWRAPASGVATFFSDAGPYGTAYPFIAIYTGEALATLTPIADNKVPWGWSCCVPFQAVSNTVYQFALDTCYGQTASFHVSLRLAVPPQLDQPQRRPDGTFHATMRGEFGGFFTLEASTNLLRWEPIYQGFSEGVPIPLADPGATNFSRRFYRIVLHPP